jgi:hypothetical protein
MLSQLPGYACCLSLIVPTKTSSQLNEVRLSHLPCSFKVVASRIVSQLPMNTSGFCARCKHQSQLELFCLVNRLLRGVLKPAQSSCILNCFSFRYECVNICARCKDQSANHTASSTFARWFRRVNCALASLPFCCLVVPSRFPGR